MTEKLEILVGPSGVGKTSMILGDYVSSRLTTRQPRLEELVDAEGNPVSTEDFERTIEEQGRFVSPKGVFVTEEYFRERMEDYVGVHRYPDVDTGEFYGIDPEFTLELIEKHRVVDQFVDLDASLEVKKRFPDSLISLVLANPRDILNRIRKRGGIDKEREQANLTDIANYLINIDFFDNVMITNPAEYFDLDSAKEQVKRLKACILNGETLDVDFDTLDRGIERVLVAIKNGYPAKKGAEKLSELSLSGPLYLTYPSRSESLFTDFAFFDSMSNNDMIRIMKDVIMVASYVGRASDDEEVKKEMFNAMSDASYYMHEPHSTELGSTIWYRLIHESAIRSHRLDANNIERIKPFASHEVYENFWPGLKQASFLMEAGLNASLIRQDISGIEFRDALEFTRRSLEVLGVINDSEMQQLVEELDEDSLVNDYSGSVTQMVYQQPYFLSLQNEALNFSLARTESALYHDDAKAYFTMLGKHFETLESISRNFFSEDSEEVIPKPLLALQRMMGARYAQTVMYFNERHRNQHFWVTDPFPLADTAEKFSQQNNLSNRSPKVITNMYHQSIIYFINIAGTIFSQESVKPVMEQLGIIDNARKLYAHASYYIDSFFDNNPEFAPPKPKDN